MGFTQDGKAAPGRRVNPDPDAFLLSQGVWEKRQPPLETEARKRAPLGEGRLQLMMVGEHCREENIETLIV